MALGQTVKKLLLALNSRGYNLTYNQKQFVARDGLVHRYYTICQAQKNELKNRYDHVELYGTPSLIRITLFLRDMWYTENGWELPTDQELWNKIREDIKQRKEDNT